MCAYATRLGQKRSTHWLPVPWRIFLSQAAVQDSDLLLCACRALENVSGLKGERIKGCTGVWVNNEKIAAVGVRAQKWVTYHGVALNVTTDLQPFQNIVPCGISSRGVTSVKQVAVHEGASDEELIREYQFGLLDAFAEVFNVELVHAKLL